MSKQGIFGDTSKRLLKTLVKNLAASFFLKKFHMTGIFGV